VTRRVLGTDRDVLAALMLDAYRGTIDDEGESIDDALGAVDCYITGMEQDHSFVVTEGDRVVAMAFVVVVDGVHYVDPIVVAADRERSGVGQDAVRILLDSLVRFVCVFSTRVLETGTWREHEMTSTVDHDGPPRIV